MSGDRDVCTVEAELTRGPIYLTYRKSLKCELSEIFCLWQLPLDWR